MKKNYFFGMLVALLMMAFSATANAQVSSMVDLFGTYKMSADTTITPEGVALKDLFTNDCEVTIAADNSIIGWDATISNFAGAGTALNVHSIKTDIKGFKISNWGTSSYWGSGIYMSTPEGLNGWASTLNDLYFMYDEETKEITVPDFTLIKMTDYEAEKGTILAEFKNVKLTLETEEQVEIADISGDWIATAGSGTYSSLEGSSYPKEYAFTLTKQSEEAKVHRYTMALTIADFPTVEIPATFNGVQLEATYDNVVLDADENIYLCDFNGNKSTSLKFTATSESRMSMDGALCLASTQTIITSGQEMEHTETLQWWMDGIAKKVVDGAGDFNWLGSFKFNIGKVTSLNGGEYADEFELVITEIPGYGYYATNFFGDVSAINRGGIPVTVDESNPRVATLKAETYCSKVGEGVYLRMFDANGGTEPIKMTVGEDGIITMDNFKAVVVDYNDEENDGDAALFEDIKAEAPKPAEPFDFVGTFTLSTTVTSEDGGEYPASFDMVVTYNSTYDIYSITEFFGYDVSAANNGGIPLTVTGDATAEITTNKYAGTPVPGEHYYKLYDAEGGSNPLKIEVVDGVLKIDDFSIQHMFYDADWNTSFEPAASFSEVTATRKVEEPYDFVGVYEVTGTVASEDGNEYPETFDMEVTYNADYDLYLVTYFFDYDVSTSNNGGILFTVTGNKTAEMATDRFAGTVEAGAHYYKVYDANGSNDSIKFEVTNDGIITMSDFSIKHMYYDESWNPSFVPAAKYTNVTCVKVERPVGIGSVEAGQAEAKVAVAGNSVIIAGAAQQVTVCDAAGRVEFSGVTNCVSGLAKGVHLVKVGNAAVKVSIK